jgi:UDP-N-acetylmuramyl pentapeptide phosphotransferase/UDP-N-acetylglucosamine-1-phosphate transferase/glycosyltransferase involved in cell wall biosynthesis
MLARRFKIVDIPDARKVHVRPIPRVGGLAIALATLISAAPVLLLYRSTTLMHAITHTPMAWLIFASVVLLTIGFVDDIINLPAKIKLIGLLGAAGLFAYYGGCIPTGPIAPHGQPCLGWLSWPLTIFWLVTVPVSLNFCDGLDGLAGGISAAAALVVAIIGIAVGEASVSFLMLALMGSLTAFLIFNFNPARIFMGDGGSLFIGFTIAAAAVVTAHHENSPLPVIITAVALSIPLVDTAVTFARRAILQRRSLFSAERGHLHHRLLDLGLSHLHAVYLLYVFAAGTALLAIAMLFGNSVVMALAVISLAMLLLVLFRTAGSARGGDLVRALRRNRQLARESRNYRKAFESLQLRLARAGTFDAWWGGVCEAAEMLHFSRVAMPMTRRDGSVDDRIWQSHDPAISGVPAMTATLPIKHRRLGNPMCLEMEVPAPTFLESAGHRIALFARLLEEYSLSALPDQPPGPFKIRIFGLARPLAGARSTRRAGKDQDVLGRIGSLDPARRKSLKLRYSKPLAELKVAFVHDFLYTYAGAERVLEQMLLCFPQADVFSLFDFLKPEDRGFLLNKPVRTSMIQKMPLARRKHRLYLPLMPMAIEQLDVSKYDIVISSSYVVAKGVITQPDQLHVCYCHSPVRFAWDMQNQYLKEAGLDHGIKGAIARLILHYIRVWDVRSSGGVDAFMTNSSFVARRVDKAYRRSATPVFPPVDTEKYTLCAEKGDFYLTASRMVPYKRIDLIVQAFNRMPDRRLVVVGEGPELENIRRLAGSNVKVVGYQPFERLCEYMRHAKGFVFAAEEDFGIVPVEAQACGTPVIAYGHGGVTESVIDGVTGLFFMEPTPESIMAAVEHFERITWDAQVIRKNAERFSQAVFKEKFMEFTARQWQEFRLRRLEAIAAAQTAAETKSQSAEINERSA